MRAKFPARVYVALRDAGYSNREVGRLLNVNERSVRRGLENVGYMAPTRVMALLRELGEIIEERAL